MGISRRFLQEITAKIQLRPKKNCGRNKKAEKFMAVNSGDNIRLKAIFPTLFAPKKK
jgi:hypothetical protein